MAEEPRTANRRNDDRVMPAVFLSALTASVGTLAGEWWPIARIPVVLGMITVLMLIVGAARRR